MSEFLSVATWLVLSIAIVMIGNVAFTTDDSRIYFLVQVPRMSELTT